jgi:5-formyltetrahydrofolate cyclo-ligase
MKATKAALRKDIRQILQSIPAEVIDSKSKAICQRLLSHPDYARSTAVFVFLSMGQEVQTYEILSRSLEAGRRVFIPKITGSKACDMELYEIRSMEDIASFPKTKWGIPEPTMDMVRHSSVMNSFCHA